MSFLQFIQWQWVDLVDILLVAVLFYQVFVLIRGTQALRIFAGMLIIYVVYLTVDALQMRLLSQILGQFIGVGVIALIIVFQQEIRRFLLLLGNTGKHNRRRFVRAMFSGRWAWTDRSSLDFKELAAALKALSQSRTGALLVFIRENGLGFYLKSGQALEARFSSLLVQQIFYNNTPLHDGAVLIKGNTLRAAKCILPITEKVDFPNHLGLRHRAAAGITEVSDALALVVSEQTGQISWSQGGRLEEDVTIEEAIDKLRQLLKSPGKEAESGA